MSERKRWIVVGYRSGEWGRCYLESKPERNVLHGTMGDYGWGRKEATALRFEKESTARWHAARWFGCKRPAEAWEVWH